MYWSRIIIMTQLHLYDRRPSLKFLHCYQLPADIGLFFLHFSWTMPPKMSPKQNFPIVINLLHWYSMSFSSRKKSCFPYYSKWMAKSNRKMWNAPDKNEPVLYTCIVNVISSLLYLKLPVIWIYISTHVHLSEFKNADHSHR